MYTVEKISEAISSRLKEMISEKQWSIAKFAKYVGIPRTTINSWILKIKIPSVENLYIIADKFNVTIDYLVGREE